MAGGSGSVGISGVLVLRTVDQSGQRKGRAKAYRDFGHRENVPPGMSMMPHNRLSWLPVSLSAA